MGSYNECFVSFNGINVYGVAFFFFLAVHVLLIPLVINILNILLMWRCVITNSINVNFDLCR